MKLTATQQKVLDALSLIHYRSPAAVAALVEDLHGNAGGAAASLRALMKKGLVEQQRSGKQGRWVLWVYRRLKVQISTSDQVTQG